MYILLLILAIIAAIVSTVALTWIFAKLRIFDLIRYFAPRLASLAFFRFLEVAVIFVAALWLFYSFFGGIAGDHDYKYTYLTTKDYSVKFTEEKRVGKEKKYSELYLPKDIVLKVVDSKIRGKERIIECYVITGKDNRLRKGTVRYPKSEARKLKGENSHYTFSSESQQFRDYRDMAERENEKIISRLQCKFYDTLYANNLDIVSGKGNFFKRTWLKISRYVLPKDGFEYKSFYGRVYEGVFCKYRTEEGQLWYTERSNKAQLLEIVNQFCEKLDEELYEIPVDDW
ncbi:MAG: hypothetical protein IJ717_12915 [Treponema sp.]|nr:hypothetical protein [Treponema sp.]